MLSRRGLLLGAAAVAAPAIIRPGILMPVKAWRDAGPYVSWSDGVALRSAAHPLTVWDGQLYHEIAEECLEVIELDMSSRRAFGVVMGRPVEAKIFCSDVVALK